MGLFFEYQSFAPLPCQPLYLRQLNRKKGYDDVAFRPPRQVVGPSNSFPTFVQLVGDNVAYTLSSVKQTTAGTRTISLPIFASENSHSLNSTAPKTADQSQLRYLRVAQVIPGVDVLKLALS